MPAEGVQTDVAACQIPLANEMTIIAGKCESGNIQVPFIETDPLAIDERNAPGITIETVFWLSR